MLGSSLVRRQRGEKEGRKRKTRKEEGKEMITTVFRQKKTQGAEDAEEDVNEYRVPPTYLLAARC